MRNSLAKKNNQQSTSYVLLHVILSSTYIPWYGVTRVQCTWTYNVQYALFESPCYIHLIALLQYCTCCDKPWI